MVESLKTAARKLGAEGIVIIKEGDSVTTDSLPASGGKTAVHHIFIKGIAIAYEVGVLG
jgi:hypothetical protein